MQTITDRLHQLNWPSIIDTLNSRGYVIVDKLLNSEESDTLKALYDIEKYFRKTIKMERYRFGLGEYKYLGYPLPPIISTLRKHLYENLKDLANGWMRQLGIVVNYPQKFAEFQEACKIKNQVNPAVLILRYRSGGHNTLHQDLYGEVFFPFQAVLFLDEPGTDYTGGEFVLTEQVPRAQSRATVLKPAKGDMLIFTTNYRPVKGTKGYYRVNMKHGVSEVRSGSRHTLGIIFHDALT